MRNAAGVHPGRSSSRNAIVTAIRRWREAENSDKVTGPGQSFLRKSDRRELARKESALTKRDADRELLPVIILTQGTVNETKKYLRIYG